MGCDTCRTLSHAGSSAVSPLRAFMQYRYSALLLSDPVSWALLAVALLSRVHLESCPTDGVAASHVLFTSNES